MQQATQLKIEEPPQGLLLPKHTVIKLDPNDAARFHEQFAIERNLLAENQKHWLKDKDLSDITDGKTLILGIEKEDKIVSGALLSMFSRQLVNKLHWYPWDAKSEHTAVLGSVWTAAAHRGLGMGKDIVKKAIEEVQASTEIKRDPLFGNLRYILASVAEDNIGSRKMFEKLDFNQVSAVKPNPIHGNPMVYYRKPVY